MDVAAPAPGILEMVALALVLLGGLMIVFMVVGSALGARRARQRRFDRLRQSAWPVQTTGQTVTVRKAMSFSAVPTLDRLIRRYLPQPAKLRHRLGRAGLTVSLGQFLLVCFLIGASVFTLIELGGLLPPLAAALLGVGAGLGLPHLYVGFRIRRRSTQFIKDFPDAIDLLVRGLKAGLPLTETVKGAGEELPGPVGETFRQVSDELKLGRKLEEALWEASRRLELQEFKFFIVSLTIQSETGGNLGETLANLSEVLRGRKQLKLKIKALSSEAKASAYIIGSLPFVMSGVIHMMNPGYLSVLVTDPRGIMMVAGGLMMYGIGMGVMFKMTRFDI